jgi:hypothetical protein
MKYVGYQSSCLREGVLQGTHRKASVKGEAKETTTPSEKSGRGRREDRDRERVRVRRERARERE